MIRYNYLPLEKTINGVNFYDITRLNWNDFEFKRGFRTYTLTRTDVDKFYMLIEREYNSLIIEDWIFFINKIPDPTELQEDQKIILPNLLDIQDFLVDQLGVQS
jgi:hypothetical protein